MERVFDFNFSWVRVHTDGKAPAMGAEAYAQGPDLHFASGAYDPSSTRGQALIGHELAHVVQQSEGRVPTTGQAKGIGINQDDQLEREADAWGARAARGEPIDRGGGATSPDAAGRGVGQVGDTYERHADAVADQVEQGKSAEALFDAFSGGGSTGAAPGGVVQFVKKGFALYGTDGLPAESEREHYKDAEQRKSYALKIEGGNVNYETAAEGDEQRNQWSGSARVQYVFTPQNVFYGQYYGPGVEEGTHDFHTRYTAAGNVTCGGWMAVSGHTLTKIGNDSGHYRPEMEGLYKMLKFLEGKGARMDGLTVVYVTPDNQRGESTAAEFMDTHQEAFDQAKKDNDKLKKLQVSNVAFDKFSKGDPPGLGKRRRDEPPPTLIPEPPERLLVRRLSETWDESDSLSGVRPDPKRPRRS